MRFFRRSAAEPIIVEMDDFPITITQSRVKMVASAVGSALFVLLGFVIFRSGEEWGVVGILFFGLCFLVFIPLIVRPGRLVIDSRGITQTTLFRTYVFPWPEVANFRALKGSIEFDDLRPAKQRPWSLSRLIGQQGSLGPGWKMKAARLAELLNASRSFWVGR